MRLFIILFFILIISSCKKNNSIKESVAIIGKTQLSISLIDSMIDYQVAELKLQALEDAISVKLISYHASQFNTNYNTILINNIYNKTKAVSNQEITNYIQQNKPDFIISNSFQVDTSLVVEKIRRIKQKERQQVFVDSLKKLYLRNVFYYPEYTRKVNTNGLISYPTKKKKYMFDVYIISDYRCPACKIVQKKILYLTKKYNEKVNFKFMQYDNEMDSISILCEAMSTLGLNMEINQFLIENNGEISLPNDFEIISEMFDINLTQLMQTFNNPTIQKTIQYNYQIFEENGIYSIPSYIVNDQLIIGKNKIDQLEEIINQLIYE